MVKETKKSTPMHKLNKTTYFGIEIGLIRIVQYTNYGSDTVFLDFKEMNKIIKTWNSTIAKKD
jgi:hypothetical protein